MLLNICRRAFWLLTFSWRTVSTSLNDLVAPMSRDLRVSTTVTVWSAVCLEPPARGVVLELGDGGVERGDVLLDHRGELGDLARGVVEHAAALGELREAFEFLARAVDAVSDAARHARELRVGARRARRVDGRDEGVRGGLALGRRPGACIARVFAARSAAAANSFVRSRTDAVAMVAGDSTSRAADVPVAEAGRR